jgi:hypothetical protein
VIQIDFSDEHTAQDRARELAGLNGKTVTLTLKTGGVLTGVLRAVGGAIAIDGRPVRPGNCASATVKEGGDWVSPVPHRADAKTARFPVRCTPTQKTAYQKQFRRDGAESLSEWILALADRAAGLR